MAQIPVVTWLGQVVRHGFDDSFKEVFDDYEAYHGEINTGNLARARVFAQWIEEGSKVLDVGCGDGTVGKFLMETRKAEMRGVDISQTAVEKVEKLGIPARVLNLNDEPLDIGEEVDYVLLSEVIEHLMYPQKVLKDAARIARKGVIVSIPNTGFLSYRLQMMRGVFPRQSFTHLHYWTRSDFHQFCGLLDLEVAREAVGEKEKGMAKAWPNLFANQLFFLVRDPAKAR